MAGAGWGGSLPSPLEDEGSKHKGGVLQESEILYERRVNTWDPSHAEPALGFALSVMRQRQGCERMLRITRSTVKQGVGCWEGLCREQSIPEVPSAVDQRREGWWLDVVVISLLCVLNVEHTAFIACLDCEEGKQKSQRQLQASS